MNNVVIAGRVAGTPAEARSPRGKPFLLFTVEVPRPDGVTADPLDVAWFRFPETAHLELHHGRQVSVAGRLSVWRRTLYDRRGREVQANAVSIIADAVKLVGEADEAQVATPAGAHR